MAVEWSDRSPQRRILCSRFCPALREGRAFLHPRILKVAANPEIISFAGGLPNPHLFPVKAIDQACQDVLREQGAAALQYAATEGFARCASTSPTAIWPATACRSIRTTSSSPAAPNRRWICWSKVLIDEGQDLIIEEPGYLGAIQAFSVYQPAFKPITLGEEGLDLAALDALLASGSNAKLLYGVPNFQNPSGVSYSRANREALAQRLVSHELLMVEDDPYGELRFEGEHLPPSPSWRRTIPCCSAPSPRPSSRPSASAGCWCRTGCARRSPSPSRPPTCTATPSASRCCTAS